MRKILSALGFASLFAWSMSGAQGFAQAALDPLPFRSTVGISEINPESAHGKMIHFCQRRADLAFQWLQDGTLKTNKAVNDLCHFSDPNHERNTVAFGIVYEATRQCEDVRSMLNNQFDHILFDSDTARKAGIYSLDGLRADCLRACQDRLHDRCQPVALKDDAAGAIAKNTADAPSAMEASTAGELAHALHKAKLSVDLLHKSRLPLGVLSHLSSKFAKIRTITKLGIELPISVITAIDYRNFSQEFEKSVDKLGSVKLCQEVREFAGLLDARVNPNPTQWWNKLASDCQEMDKQCLKTCNPPEVNRTVGTAEGLPVIGFLMSLVKTPELKQVRHVIKACAQCLLESSQRLQLRMDALAKQNKLTD